MVPLIVVMVFLCVSVLLWVLAGSGAARLDDRLREVGDDGVSVVDGTELGTKLAKGIIGRLFVPALGSLRDRMVGLAPATLMETTRKRIDRAGPPYMSAARFLSLRILSLVLGVVAADVAVTVYHAPLLYRCGLAACALAIGLLLPDYVLD